MITPQQVRDLLDYDPQTGRLMRAQTGGTAGGLNGRGYTRTSLLGKAYVNSRLVWAYVHGRWPDGNIDHIDGNKSNNRIENLRDVSQQINCENRQGANINNQAGYLGVSWSAQKQRWKATISLNRVYRHLGFFKLPAEAHQAYLKAKRDLHEGCTI